MKLCAKCKKFALTPSILTLLALLLSLCKAARCQRSTRCSPIMWQRSFHKGNEPVTVLWAEMCLWHRVRCVIVDMEEHRGQLQGTRTCSRGEEQPRLSNGQKRKSSVWLTSGDLVSNQTSWSPVDLQVRMGFAWLLGTASQNGARQTIFPQWQQHSSPRGEQQLEKGCWTGQQGLGGSTVLQRCLAYAFGTSAHITWLPVSKCFWAVHGVSPNPLKGSRVRLHCGHKQELSQLPVILA